MPVYKLKHPVHKHWIDIVADTLAQALSKLRKVA